MVAGLGFWAGRGLVGEALPKTPQISVPAGDMDLFEVLALGFRV